MTFQNRQVERIHLHVIFFFVRVNNKWCSGTYENLQLMLLWSGIQNQPFYSPWNYNVSVSRYNLLKAFKLWRKRFCFTASASWWYVLWWTSISVPAGVSAPVFYPQHEGDATQFDMSKVWCYGSRLAALLVLSEPIRGSERVADQKHNLHILTDSFVAQGNFFPFFSLPAETDLTWYVLHLSFTRQSKNPKVSLPTAVNHRLWAQHNLNHKY